MRLRGQGGDPAKGQRNSNMARPFSRLASNLALAACLSMAATPALAGGGWGGGGWGRGHRGHHGDNDAGWIIGGIIGIGIIAAMASSASKANKDRETRQRDGGYPDRDYRSEGGDYPGDYRGQDRGGYGQNRGSDYRPSAANRGIDGAVDTCVSEVERGSTRVDTVDSVDRDGEGWRVEGKTNGGKAFACSVGNSGRIRSVTVDGRAAMLDEEMERQEG
jgi:hypothetical protein